MCQLKKIRYKPNYLHFHDFSRWPPFDISNIFINLNSAIGMNTVTLFTKVHVNSLSITIAMTF